MSEFSFLSDNLSLPPGAIAKTHRRWLRYDGTAILAITPGPFRNYIYPLCTPAGFQVTSEAPADHPHHNSLWIGSDHIRADMPIADGTHEEYTYSFYVNETFQGRSPGRIIETDCQSRAVSETSFEIQQTLEWRGPVEWGAPEGRVVMEEIRTITTTRKKTYNIVDIRSELSAVCSDLMLGPTRHALFNVRVADSMIAANGGRIIDENGPIKTGKDAFLNSSWMNFTGPVGGGFQAGITVIPGKSAGMEHSWFAADWGVMTVGPFRAAGVPLKKGSSFTSAYRLIVHDGAFDPSLIEPNLFKVE